MDSTKDHILDAIRQNKPQQKYSYPVIPNFPKSTKPILDEFKVNLIEAAGTWYDVKNEQEAQNLMKKLYPDAKVLCSATPEIQGNKDITTVKDPHELNDVDVGIIRAKFGVSETGMVWITQTDMIVDALGFLSQHLVILLKPDQIVRDMYEAYAKVDLNKDNYGCFMMGPSATADIGAVMVQGAQGARSLAVFFI